MAQPNVVREPSMDEILASIRRIIESNEPVMQSGLASGMAEPEGFSGRPANDDSEEVTLTVDDAFSDDDRDYAEVEASTPVLRAVAANESYAEASTVRDIRQPVFAQPAPQQQKSLSLADVAARVRAASERSTLPREDAGNQYAAVVQPPVASSEPAASISAPVEELHHQGPVAQANEETQVGTRDTPVQSSHEEPTTYAPEPVSLLSSMAGEQVARSFQDLAIAIDNAERRSLDEIAEEMLRPMLQEWLDDNLPTLVERLVREEIERVARGPRR